MKKVILILCLICAISQACVQKITETDIEAYKEEILNAEEAFAAMSDEKGTMEAFLHFAADDAVLLRGNSIVGGKDQIKEYFMCQTLRGVKLDWKPDFIDASTSGDLGYTYGRFTFSAVDSTGNIIESTGIFHTVWKRQADGSWKYVWD